MMIVLKPIVTKLLKLFFALKKSKRVMIIPKSDLDESIEEMLNFFLCIKDLK